jgi:hypothetical protein
MSTTKAFRGFTPARKIGGGYNNEAVTDIIAWSSTTSQQYLRILLQRSNLLEYSWVVNMLKMVSRNSRNKCHRY